VQRLLVRRMIQITPHMRLLVAVEPIDFRAGIDGLAGICRQRLAADPFSGGLFIFRNRARTAIKILVYDGQGFWLCQKRLSSGRFAFWPDGTAPLQPLQACELQPGRDVSLDGGRCVRLPALPVRPGAADKALIGALHDVFADALKDRLQVADLGGQLIEYGADRGIMDFDGEGGHFLP
jgi:transposase